MANLLSILRIISSPFLLLFPFPGIYFFVLYILIGFSDILDGIIARKTGTESKLGATLDSIGDLVFVLFASLSIFPVISVTPFLLLLIALVFIVRVGNMVLSKVTKGRIILLHTRLNKVTGFLLYVFPLTIDIVNTDYSIPMITLIALWAGIEETYLILKKEN